MVVVSYSGKEVNAKLVFYGPGLSGKTTNLEAIYDSVPATHRGKMVSMKTRSERTLFFDFLPVDLGDLHGFKTRFLIYTVPGQVYYNATRKLVLRGVDAIVFVADSQRGKMDENRESLANLRENLAEYGMDLDAIPWVIQYNKRDLPDIHPVEELERELNPGGVPHHEAVAQKGLGVFETFRAVAKLLLAKLDREIQPEPGRHASPIVERMERVKSGAHEAPRLPAHAGDGRGDGRGGLPRATVAAVPASGPAPSVPPAAAPGGDGGGPLVAELPIPPGAGTAERRRPGFWGRLFGRRAAGAPAAGGPGAPVTKEIVVPVGLTAEEAARGVELRVRIVLTADERAGAAGVSAAGIEIEREEIRAA